MFSGSANIIYKKSRTCTPIFKGKNVVLYSSFQPPKAAAQATVSGFSNMKPEPWAGRGRTNGFCRPRLPTARHGRLQALGLSRHITTRNTPLHVGVVLDNSMTPKTDSEKKAMVDKPYHSILGTVMWGPLATRPDLAFSVSL